MEGILEAFKLDNTFFYQFALFVVLFLLLKVVYFGPFLRLLELRHQKTVASQQEAERMLKEAATKFDEYQVKLAQRKAEAKVEFDRIIEAAKKEEAQIINQAREEAKRITQKSLDEITLARANIEQQLQTDVEILAHKVAEKLMPR